MRFFIGWGNWDIYISTQREQILRFNELTKSTREQEQSLRNVMFSGQFARSKIISDAKNHVIVFFNNDKTSAFFGVVDTDNKRLLLFDRRKGDRYSDAMWSPTGSRLALLRRGFFNQYIDFYEFNDENKPILLKMFNLGQLRVLGISGWSEDSTKLYVSYIDVIDNKKKEKTIELFK